MSKIISFCFFIVLLVGCKTQHLEKTESNNLAVEDSKTSDSSITELILPFKQKLDSSMNQVLGVSSIEMSTGTPQGLLGNLVCDLSYQVGNKLYQHTTKQDADFVVLNNGGLRTFLPEGNVTRRKIFEIMPFENELVVITLSHEKTVELFQYIGEKTQREGTRRQGVPVSGNVSLTLKGNVPVEVLINKKPLRAREYKVMTTDYLANGGDNMAFFLNPIKYEKLGVKLRDAIMLYVIEEQKMGKSLDAKFDNRINYGD